MKRINVFLLAIPLFLVSVRIAWGQQIQGALVSELKLSEALHNGSVTGKFSLEDLVGIIGDADFQRIEALELKIEIPRGINQYRNSFSLTLFKNVAPQPSTGTDLYRGAQAYSRMMPVLDTCYIIIPLSEGRIFRQDATTLVVPQAVPDNEFPLILTIQPVAKALPKGIYSHVFTITLKPILAQTGSLAITDKGTGDSRIKTVIIDGKIKTGTLSGIVLAAGVHTLLVITQSGEQSGKSVMIESGKTYHYVHEPTPAAEALVQFSVPKGMDLYIDGKPVVFKDDQRSVHIAPGSHKITFSSGDFSFSRTIEVSQGDHLKCGLQIDLVIEKL